MALKRLLADEDGAISDPLGGNVDAKASEHASSRP